MGLISSNQKGKGYFNQYILLRIKRNKNFLCCVVGPTGSGKSYSCLKEAEILDPNFSADNICFTPKQFLDLINDGDLKKGSVIIFDEAGVALSSKQWQSITNKMIHYVLQTFRHRNFILFFSAPHFSFIDASARKLFHATFETQKIDYEKKTVSVKPLLIQVNQRTGQLYFKYLRIANKEHGITPVVKLNVGMPSKELLVAYEKKKNLFTQELNRTIQEDLAKLDKPKATKELTDKQQEVYDLLRKGLLIPAIAKELNVQPSAIYKQLEWIKKKGFNIKQIKEENRVIGYKLLGKSPI